MLLYKYIIFNLFFLSYLSHVPKDRNIFAPPVKIPVLLSSNFGELRPDHFHAGIDIKTQGTSGLEIFSCADGYIYRIGVSPTGFGKALYIKHPSGYSTVYAHLDRFTPEIESYVRALQYEKKSYSVSLFPDKEKFPVSQGDLIAWSGNSGSSGGPHLHFEVREADNELPVNPLLFEIGADDNLPPVFERVAMYPVGRDAFVNNRPSKLILNTKGTNGQYSVSYDREIILTGNIGFGVKMHDLLNGGPNRCTPYSITVEADSIIVFRYVMDGFAFSESRFVNSHMDYETWMKDNIMIQRTYALPNDRLTTYKTLLNRGIVSFNDDKVHSIRITATDAHNNKSILSFKVRSATEKPAIPVAENLTEEHVMPYGKTNRFTTEDCDVSIPSGALYDTLRFTYKKSPGSVVMLSDLHSIHNRFTPLHRSYSLSIRPAIIPEGKESKMLIVQLNENMSKVPVNSTFTGGFIKADVSSFGSFFVGIDTIAPSISASGLTPGINLTGKKEIRIRIKDDFSGIKSYEPALDGKWALFEYDPKNNLLVYKFEEKYLEKGKTHSLSLKVTDNRDNESYYSCEFTW